jgi:hypothetical protein
MPPPTLGEAAHPVLQAATRLQAVWQRKSSPLQLWQDLKESQH